MRVRKRFANVWQKDALFAAGLVLLALLFIFKIGTLLPDASPGEINAVNKSSSLRNIFDNPLYAPHKLAQYGLQKAGLNGLTAMRAVSSIFGIVFVIAFHSLVKRWHSSRIALASTVLLASSSWLLAVSRSATPTILLTTWFMVIFLLLWFRHSRRVRSAPLLLLLGLAGLLYIPGTVYLLGLVALFYVSKVTDFFKYMKRGPIAGGGLLGIVLLAPLAFAFARRPSLISEWLLLPDSLSVGQFFDNLRGLATTFFYQSQSNPEFWLDRLPLLDVFSGTMILLGIYAYRYHLKMERTPLLALVVLLAVIVIGAAGTQLIFLLLPFIYILTASGMAYMLEMWYSVFPRNPFARVLGTSLLSIAVVFSAYYNISRYFIAWANAPETKQTYSVDRPE